MRCLRDPQFKEQLRTNPVETLVAAGVPEAEIDVNATQAPADVGAQALRTGRWLRARPPRRAPSDTEPCSKKMRGYAWRSVSA